MSDEPIIEDAAAPMLISTTMAVRIVNSEGHSSDQAVRWEYRPADPYAMQMHIVPGEGQAVWTLSREAAWDAIRRGKGKGLIGDGDVKFDVTVGRVRLYLYGADGSWARLSIERDALWVYLRATLAVVPLGEEHRFYDLRAELGKLLPDADQGATRERAEESGDEGATPMD